MRVVSWFFRIVLFLIALGFAVTNTEITELHFFGAPVSWRAPLVLFLLAFFAAGTVLGLLAVVPTLYRQRREIGRLRKEIRLNAKTQAAAAQAPSADAPSTGQPGPVPVPRLGA
jgi:uncharacterized integral membrane protein